MTNNDFIIREIQPKDNSEIAKVIRDVLIELGAPKVGTAYEDKATDTMFENYQKRTATYYVVEHQNKVVGGAGIAHLENCKEAICELQKMYLLPVLRKKGVGSKLIKTCLEKAKQLQYTHCYLETMPYMEAAQTLYKKNGFTNLDKALGDTGHYACNVWMIKEL